MKQKIAIIILSLSVIFLLCFNIVATSNMKSIDVSVGAKILIDNNEFFPKDANGDDVEIFIYNGTTYVPIRAVTELFGKTISYDGETNTISISSKEMPKEEESVVVYVTETGSKYHRSGCRYLDESQYSVSLSEAVKYYTPCSVCNP